MSWHPAASQVVLFGGLPSKPPESAAPADPIAGLNDTWAWDGALWSQVQDSGPPGRGYSSLAPAPGGEVLLFGGRLGSTFWNDTWIWDGRNWTQVADAGPDFYESPMAYDPSQNVAVLVNNFVESIRETWQWDSARWIQVDDAAPVLKRRFLAWDVPTSAMVMCGRRPEGSQLVTCVWAQSRWVQLSDMGPMNDVQEVMSSPAGVLARTSQETWLWDGSARRWTEVQDMGGRLQGETASAWDETHRVGVLFDGLQGRTWTVAPPSPG
jgi:hypothetical protein